jgi:hypothetical protein
MKIELLDEYNYTLYLNNLYVKDLNLDNKDDIEKYLKKLFLIVKNRYDVDISGMFEIDIYVNSKYGIVIDNPNNTIHAWIDLGCNQESI